MIGYTLGSLGTWVLGLLGYMIVMLTGLAIIIAGSFLLKWVCDAIDWVRRNI